MLYFVPTPIGNLGDMTLRSLDVLKNVKHIYAEDTRRTRQLMYHFEIKTSIRSYHEHNKMSAGAEIIALLNDGEDVALVSDAGMPCISDPGLELVAECVSRNIPYTVLPGATAFATAFVGAGIKDSRFCFMGFLPKTDKHKKRSLSAVAHDPRPHIFYESPHSLSGTLRVMLGILGNRKMTIARELTKVHEEYLRGTVEEMISHFETAPPRGEFVLVVEGSDDDAGGEKTSVTADRLDEEIDALLAQGQSAKDISERLSRELGMRKKAVYEKVIQKHSEQYDRSESSRHSE